MTVIKRGHLFWMYWTLPSRSFSAERGFVLTFSSRVLLCMLQKGGKGMQAADRGNQDADSKIKRTKLCMYLRHDSVWHAAQEKLLYYREAAKPTAKLWKIAIAISLFTFKAFSEFAFLPLLPAHKDLCSSQLITQLPQQQQQNLIPLNASLDRELSSAKQDTGLLLTRQQREDMPGKKLEVQDRMKRDIFVIDK